MLSTPTDIINRSVALYKANWHTLLGYIKILFLLTAVITLAGYGLGGAPTFTWQVGLGMAVSIVISLLLIWVSIALMRTLANMAAGSEVKPIKTELRESTSLFLPFIFVSILSGLAIAGGFILLIIPGIIFSVWFAFATYALTIDGKHGVEALRMSKNLVKGRWWEVLARLFVPGLFFGIAAFLAQSLIQFPFSLLLKSMASTSYIYIFIDVASALLAQMAGLLVAPLATGAIVILYTELKRNPQTTTNTTGMAS